MNEERSEHRCTRLLPFAVSIAGNKRKLNSFRLFRFEVGCANPQGSPPFIHNLTAGMVQRARRGRKSDGVCNHSPSLWNMGCYTLLPSANHCPYTLVLLRPKYPVG